VITMAKDREEAESVLTAAGRLFTTGAGVNWSAVFAGLQAQRVALPTYAFQRHRFWLDDRGDALSPMKTRPADLVARLKALPPNDQHRQLLELVCAHAAAVLGHTGSHDIDAERPFQDLGFESLTGVELRNRLKAETGLAGLALSRTLIFDYPTPTALADHLQHLIVGDDEQSDDEMVWSTLRKIPLHELRRTGLLDKLLVLAREPEKTFPEPTISDDIIDSLGPDALIAMALNQEEDRDAQ
jgi:acyl transferase domain-containing protein